MQSDSETNAQSQRGVGRPVRKSLAMERTSSSSAGGSAPPTPQPSSVVLTPGLNGDLLADQEYAAFGIEAEIAPLPPPPSEVKGGPQSEASSLLASSAATGARTTLRAAALTAPGRAKRPKNVKFSPAKGKALARRSVTGKGPNGEDIVLTSNSRALPNNDYCDVCLGKGHFLCCDGGCLRSFHFLCLDPPLDVDDVPDEAWFCKACRAARHPPPKPPRGFFRELLYRVDCENPKTFALTPEIKNLYKNVVSGSNGEFLDTKEHRPPSKVLGRSSGEDRDGYKLKEKSGRAIVCYNCNETANLARQRRIISCDFCEQHWHLDCLDPPMTGMPPPTRKWMCPLHSEQILPKKRIPKHTSIVDVKEPRTGNNGDIIIIPRQVSRPLDDDRYEEMTVNRVRYQVPEETVILDFWGRITGAYVGGTHAAAPKNSKRARSPADLGSPLTSVGDASDADPPEVALLGYSPYSRRTTDRRAPRNIDALANLAHVAEKLMKDADAYKGYDDVKMTDGINDKGKGRAHQDGLGSESRPSKRSRASIVPLSSNSMHFRPLDNGGQRSGSISSATLPEIPPFRGGRSPVASMTGSPLIESKPVMLGKRPHSLSFSQLPNEVIVKSKEDLRALMHVRKMLSAMDGSSSSDRVPVGSEPTTKAALLGFIEGAPIVPKLDYIKPEALRQPWDLPWDSNGAVTGPESRSSSSSSVAPPAAQNTASTSSATVPPASTPVSVTTAAVSVVSAPTPVAPSPASVVPVPAAAPAALVAPAKPDGASPVSQSSKPTSISTAVSVGAKETTRVGVKEPSRVKTVKSVVVPTRITPADPTARRP